MIPKEIQDYAILFHNGWEDLIGHEKEGIESVCVKILNVSCIQ